MTTIGRTFPKPAPEADPKPEKEGKAKKADTEKKS